jgi:hypothetical protein
MPPLSLSLGPCSCTSCESRRVRDSRQQNALEWFMLLFLLRPYRCEFCNDRHYGFIFRPRVQASGAPRTQVSR